MPTKTLRETSPEYNVSSRYQDLLLRDRKGLHPYVVFLGLRSFETRALLKRIEAGFSYAAFERLQKNIDIPIHELADLIQISLRTLNRRKHHGKLEPDESDRLVRLSRLLGKAVELFEGDLDAARRWLTSTQVGLGGVRPLDLVKSEVGAREVESLIGRLEHGVFS